MQLVLPCSRAPASLLPASLSDCQGSTSASGSNAPARSSAASQSHSSALRAACGTVTVGCASLGGLKWLLWQRCAAHLLTGETCAKSPGGLASLSPTQPPTLQLPPRPTPQQPPSTCSAERPPPSQASTSAPSCSSNSRASSCPAAAAACRGRLRRSSRSGTLQGGTAGTRGKRHQRAGGQATGRGRRGVGPRALMQARLACRVRKTSPGPRAGRCHALAPRRTLLPAARGWLHGSGRWPPHPRAPQPGTAGGRRGTAGTQSGARTAARLRASKRKQTLVSWRTGSTVGLRRPPCRASAHAPPWLLPPRCLQPGTSRLPTLRHATAGQLLGHLIAADVQTALPRQLPQQQHLAGNARGAAAAVNGWRAAAIWPAGARVHGSVLLAGAQTPPKAGQPPPPSPGRPC